MNDDDVFEFKGDSPFDPRTQLSNDTIRQWLADTSDIVESRPVYDVGSLSFFRLHTRVLSVHCVHCVHCDCVSAVEPMAEGHAGAWEESQNPGAG